MDYKTVMVGLALDRPNDARLAVAGDLAERFGARVIGVAAWLRSHGIVASTVVSEKATGTIAQLDKVAADIDAGVVIAGAYGHSRLREWILGGVTRHLATESRRCAFLSR